MNVLLFNCTQTVFFSNAFGTNVLCSDCNTLEWNCQLPKHRLLFKPQMDLLVPRWIFRVLLRIQTLNLRLGTALWGRSSLLSLLAENQGSLRSHCDHPVVSWGGVEVSWIVCSEGLWVGFLWGYGHSPMGKWLGQAVYLGLSLPLSLNRSCSTW